MSEKTTPMERGKVEDLLGADELQYIVRVYGTGKEERAFHFIWKETVQAVGVVKMLLRYTLPRYTTTYSDGHLGLPGRSRRSP